MVTKSSPFRSAYRQMLIAGWIRASESCTVIGLSAREHGEGVTTLARGFGREFNLEFGGPALVIHATDTGRRAAGARVVTEGDIAADGSLPNDAIRGGGGKLPDELHMAGGLQVLGARADKVAAMMARLRRSYRFVTVDVGPFSEASCPFWRKHVDHLLLVIDVESARREVLEHFRRELDRSVVKFDGFVANKRVHHVPRFLYRMFS